MKPSIARFINDLAIAAATGALLAGAVTVACTATERSIAKTAADVAIDACRFAFGQHPEELPPGVSVQDFCKTAEHFQPFVDSILSARMGVARRAGTLKPADAGAGD